MTEQALLLVQRPGAPLEGQRFGIVLLRKRDISSETHCFFGVYFGHSEQQYTPTSLTRAFFRHVHSPQYGPS